MNDSHDGTPTKEQLLAAFLESTLGSGGLGDAHTLNKAALALSALTSACALLKEVVDTGKKYNAKKVSITESMFLPVQRDLNRSEAPFYIRWVMDDAACKGGPHVIISDAKTALGIKTQGYPDIHNNISATWEPVTGGPANAKQTWVWNGNKKDTADIEARIPPIQACGNAIISKWAKRDVTRESLDHLTGLEVQIEDGCLEAACKTILGEDLRQLILSRERDLEVKSRQSFSDFKSRRVCSKKVGRSGSVL